MGSRSDKQCRERYCNVLDPAIKHDLPWEPAEDEKLLSAIAEHTQPNGKIRRVSCSALHDACFACLHAFLRLHAGTRCRLHPVVSLGIPW